MTNVKALYVAGVGKPYIFPGLWQTWKPCMLAGFKSPVFYQGYDKRKSPVCGRGRKALYFAGVMTNMKALYFAGVMIDMKGLYVAGFGKPCILPGLWQTRIRRHETVAVTFQPKYELAF
jgi:hypothetical protein